MKHVRPNVSQFAAQWTQAQPITEPEKPKLKPRPRRRNRIPILETSDLPHEEREADENVSVEAVNDGKRAAENVACFVNDAGYRRNVRAYRKEIREIRPDNGRVKPPGQPAAAFDGFPPSSGWKMPAEKAATENRQTLHTCRRMQQASNPLSKAHQKQHMKQAFFARARERKAADAAVENIPEVLRRFLPKLGERQVHLFPVALVCSLLLFMTGGLSSFMPLGEAISHAFIMGTYPAEEADVLAAERAYCEMEKELEDELDHYEARHPGCDEYSVKAQEIWHDPYALCAIISAYLGGEEWTIDSAYPVMERYFKLQYVLTEKITTETRYRTEQRVGQQLVTDPKTGAQRWESYTYEVEVPYTYRICDVKLENKNLSHQPVYSMSREKMGFTRCTCPRWATCPICLPESRTLPSSKTRFYTTCRRNTNRLTRSLESSSRKRKNIWAFRMSGAARRRIRPLTAPALCPMYLPTAAYTTRAGSARRGCTASVRRLQRMKRVPAT